MAKERRRVKKSSVTRAEEPSARAKQCLNPLAVMVAGVLERLQKEDGRNEREFAGALSLGYSTYRFIMTEALALRPSKSVQLSKLSDLNWPRLARVLVATQYLEDRRSDGVSGMRYALSELFSLDPELRGVLQVPESVWAACAALEGQDLAGDKVRQVLRSHQLLQHLEDFIKGREVISREDGVKANFGGVLPSSSVEPHFLEALVNIAESLRAGVPAPLDIQQLARFENFNTRMQRISRLFILTKDVEVLQYSVERQVEFSWRYLLQDQFVFLGVLFLPKKGKRDLAEAARHAFTSALCKHWLREAEGGPDEQEFERVARKIHFKPLDSRGSTKPEIRPEALFAHSMEWANVEQEDPSRSFALKPKVIDLFNVAIYDLINPVNTIVCVDNFASDSQVPFAATCNAARSSSYREAMRFYWQDELEI